MLNHMYFFHSDCHNSVIADFIDDMACRYGKERVVFNKVSRFIKIESLGVCLLFRKFTNENVYRSVEGRKFQEITFINCSPPMSEMAYFEYRSERITVKEMEFNNGN